MSIRFSLLRGEVIPFPYPDEVFTAPTRFKVLFYDRIGSPRLSQQKKAWEVRTYTDEQDYVGWEIDVPIPDDLWPDVLAHQVLQKLTT